MVASLLLGFIGMVTSAPSASPSDIPTSSLPQAIIAYGFFRSSYSDFDKLMATQTSSALRDMNALQTALDSLGCDLPTRLAFPHEAFVVPPSASLGQWIGFPRSSQQGVLFVTQAIGLNRQRVWVVLSSVAPARTTVFSLQSIEEANLVYDSFKKREISNAPNTVMGAVIAVTLEGDSIVLKEGEEPGSRPGRMGEVGRVFKVEITDGKVLLNSVGVLPQR